jgi:mRNA interferase ChpB
MATVDRGDIYLVSLDLTAGHAQRASRPGLVVPQKAFNQASEIQILSPVTNDGEFAKSLGNAVPISGINTESHCEL